MGLFNLFSRKSNKVENKNAVDKNNISESRAIIQRSGFDYLPVHPDILDLLWVIDGPKKNYENKPISKSRFEIEGIIFTITFSGTVEPSAIYTKLPISNDVDRPIERPPYYPNYYDLTSDQKGIYWRLLADPYNSDIDIGYVFILYYGLERHLMNGNFTKAFDVIIKLRDIHLNKSFQIYSGNALILSCLMHQKPEMVLSFLNSLDKNHELNFSSNLFLMTHHAFKIPLTANDVMRMARSFEFENNNYIKKYPELFEKTMKLTLMERVRKEDILVNDFIKPNEQSKLRKEKLRVFSNISLSDNEIEVPIYTEHFKFKKAMYDILEETHERVKDELKVLKKNGDVKYKTVPKPPPKLLEFDQVREKELLKQLSSKKEDLLSRHFVFIELQEFYYRYRNLDSKYLNLCINYCEQDIDQLERMQVYYKTRETKKIHDLKSIYSSSEMKEEVKRIENEGFIGRVPAFERLAIIYEKQYKYNEAISICEKAIAYSRDLRMDTKDFEDRLNKLISKQTKV